MAVSGFLLLEVMLDLFLFWLLTGAEDLVVSFAGSLSALFDTTDFPGMDFPFLRFPDEELVVLQTDSVAFSSTSASWFINFLFFGKVLGVPPDFGLRVEDILAFGLAVREPDSLGQGS